MLPTKTRTQDRAEFLTDIITTAVEGGIGYWSQVSEYRWWSPTLDGGTAEHPDGLPNAYVTIHESDESEEHPKVQAIGVDDVARALGLLRKGPVKGISEDRRQAILHCNRENTCAPDEGLDIDADLADCIVQIAMFGEVVYG